VDEHTLTAIRNIEKLKTTKQKRLHYLADILKNVKQEILFLSILLHDIGKVAYSSELYVKRHEAIGYRMLKDIMEKFPIEQSSRQKVEFLVRNHIVLSRLALTRDVDAPETIIQLAELVETEENLNALYLITYADMTAVNPHFWTEWKAYLFHEIYSKTRDYLRGIKRQYS
jgi:[protein-PII] uridylyltransferase